MIFDSKSVAVTSIHRHMVQTLKEKRAEGHFVGSQLETAIQVYDVAVPAHAQAINRLKISRNLMPGLCLVYLDERGLPQEVMWSCSYKNSTLAMQSLDKALGIQDATASKGPPIIALVGNEQTLLLEIEAKLRALQSDAWKNISIKAIKVTNSLPGLNGPSLALIDPTTDNIYWSQPLIIGKADEALQALASQLQTSYSVPKQIVWPKDGTVLLYVSGGTVAIGSDQSDQDAKPRHLFNLKEAYYYIGRTEVTVGQFQNFVSQSRYITDCEKMGRSFVFLNGKFQALSNANWKTPQGSASPSQNTGKELPVTHISLNDANEYCSWAGLRLPSEQEWENAAGPKNYPWGDLWDAKLCRHSLGKLGATPGPLPVGSFPLGASPAGALDMAGNVYEWTSSVYTNYPGGATNPRMNGMRRVIRGGSFGNDETSDYLTNKRTAIGSQETTVALGFRVCLGGPAKP